MNIKIEPIEERDYEDLINLFLEFAEFENLAHKMVNSVERMKKEKAYFHGFTARNEQDQIIGYATYFFAYYTWTGKYMYMDDLYIKQDYRKQGIGTLLINKVIEHAKSTECNGLRWQVSNWNDPAIKFYTGLGAKINEVEQNCDLLF